MTRTLTLVLTGAWSGVLGLAAVVVARATLGRDMGGDTESPSLALLLAICAIVFAVTAVGVAASRVWSRGLSAAVGIVGVIVGFGGLIYLVLATLITGSMFPDLLLQRLNLTIALIMGLTGLTGIGLLTRRTDRGVTADTAGPWLVRSWHPVTAGFAIGITAAWIWSAFIWPRIPYECCLL